MAFEPRHPGDAKDLPQSIPKAPTNAPVTGIRDVVVIPTTYVDGDYPDEEPAGDEPVELEENLTLERLPHDDVELVLNACTPRGHYFLGVRQFGGRYAFVRRVDRGEYAGHHFAWDDDHHLFNAIVLSRLVADNSHSLAYAARVIDHRDGLQQVVPVDAPGFVATYRARRGRDWLTTTEARELRQLLADYLAVKDSLPWKVSHPLNLSEDAVHMQLLPRALLLVTTGLEAMVNTDKERVSKQFRKRLPLLAEEVGVEGIDERFADDLYTARSEAAHGAEVSMFKVKPERTADDGPEQPHADREASEAEADDVAPLAMAQDLLRASTRKAIQDSDFRAVFASEDTLRSHWPVRL
jgi:hypothetical protein